jgi:hypothetical protein
MENKLTCNRFPECRKYSCKQYEDSDNKLWYCLVKSHGCEKIMKNYHTLCECISKLVNNLIVRYKNGKNLRSLNKSRRKAKLGYEYIPPFRPPGGYLRYALFMNKKDRLHFKDCLYQCLKSRREHHCICEFPYPLSIHENEIQYLQNAIKMIDADLKTIRIFILTKLIEEIQDVKNILNEPKLSQKSINTYQKLLELRELNKDTFEINNLSGWITDDNIEFIIKKNYIYDIINEKKI